MSEVLALDMPGRDSDGTCDGKDLDISGKHEAGIVTVTDLQDTITNMHSGYLEWFRYVHG